LWGKLGGGTVLVIPQKQKRVSKGKVKRGTGRKKSLPGGGRVQNIKENLTQESDDAPERGLDGPKQGREDEQSETGNVKRGPGEGVTSATGVPVRKPVCGSRPAGGENAERVMLTLFSKGKKSLRCRRVANATEKKEQGSGNGGHLNQSA